jgi:hypothetical protein
LLHVTLAKMREIKKTVLVIGAILIDDGILILPAFLLGIIAIACTGEVLLDVRRHPHHRFSKF